MNSQSPAARTFRTTMESLADAAAAAGYAPSFRNTQPWRWQVGTDTMDLYLEHGRMLKGPDPDARLATLSCGVALHHARVALAAEGWHVTIARIPDERDPEQLANIRIYAPAVADPVAVRRMRTISTGRTDRGPSGGASVGADVLLAISAAIQAEGARLQLLRPDQAIEFATAADPAGAEGGDPCWPAGAAFWSHRDRPMTAGNDKARLGILHGRRDEPRDWLRAGEALSAGWLTATERGISVLPLSVSVEGADTRDTLRPLLSDRSRPFLVLRFGTVDAAESEKPHSPRLPVDQIVQRI